MRWLIAACVNPHALAVAVKLLNSAAFEKVSRYGSCRSFGSTGSTSEPLSSGLYIDSILLQLNRLLAPSPYFISPTNGPGLVGPKETFHAESSRNLLLEKSRFMVRR